MGSADSQTSHEMIQRHNMSPPPSVFDQFEPVLTYAGFGPGRFHVSRRRVGHDRDPQQSFGGSGNPRQDRPVLVRRPPGRRCPPVAQDERDGDKC
jgi:hypothetical protein